MTKPQLEQVLTKLITQPVSIRQSGANIKIEWDHEPLKYKHLAEISDLLGTDAIDIYENEAFGSCCSFGFPYVRLTVRGVDLD